MKMVIVLTAILFCSFVASAQSVKEQNAIMSDIKTVMNDQAADWNRGDIEAFMRGYWNSEKLVFASSDGVTHGWQPTLDRYKKSYDSRSKMGILTFSDLEMTILSKDAAVVLGSWSLAREKDNPRGKFTLIFRKFKDGWRIVHDHTS